MLDPLESIIVIIVTKQSHLLANPISLFPDP